MGWEEIGGMGGGGMVGQFDVERNVCVCVSGFNLVPVNELH